jgi:hypothetical protein
VTTSGPVRAARLALFAGLLTAARGHDVLLVAAEQPASAFDGCAPSAGESWTYDQLLCLRQAGNRENAREEVARRLVAMGAGDAARAWPTLVLAHVRLDQLRRAEAVALYETAADGFARSGEAEGEVIARQNLALQFRLRGEVDVAARHVARAVAAAEASRAPLAIARAAVVEAVHAMATGGDVGRAHRVLVRADRLVSPATPIGLRRTILFQLANASMALGDTDTAVEALERHRALRAEDGSRQDAATVEFNDLIAQLTRAASRPHRVQREHLVARAEAVRAEASAVNERLVEAQSHQLLGDLLARSEPERAAAHLQRCLDIEAELKFPRLRAGCLWSLSHYQSLYDPKRAEQSSAAALSLLDADSDRRTLAFAWRARLRLLWRTLPEESAIAQSHDALDAVERLRSSQTGENSRAGLFGNWARDYQWLTGRLLEARQPRLAQAFEVGERLRSRVLLERLTRAGSTERGGAASDGLGRRRIAETQRRLLSTTLGDAERRMLLDQLRLLELEREELTEGLVPPIPVSAVPFASIDAVQRALAENEVMVWFSIAPWTDVYGEFGGGSWAVTMTRSSADVHRLNGLEDLDVHVAGLLGLLRERDGDAALWAPAARRLGEALLGKALAQVPSTTTSLVVVTDDALHRMPFEVLSLRSGPMLGQRFDISVTPSATLWLRSREARAPSSGNRVLVLADPDVSRGSPDGTLRLAALPGARREAKAISTALGLDGDDIRQGAAASEQFVKRAAMDAFGVLHLAAHARADTTFPDRSAVFLSPGGHDEDGWLQPTEIAELDLHGRLVVLSACDAAEGSLLSGEGPLSLARAFFAAGARGVVATRWPLRDDDAEFMMARFYEALADGHGVSAALQEARRHAIDAGLPAAAWAGIAVLGDGLHRPVAARESRRPSLLIVAVAAALTGAGALWIRSRRTRRRSPAPAAH